MSDSETLNSLYYLVKDTRWEMDQIYKRKIGDMDYRIFKLEQKMGSDYGVKPVPDHKNLDSLVRDILMVAAREPKELYDLSAIYVRKKIEDYVNGLSKVKV